MPFLGKDWRSYGDEWIRTEQGWERTKVLECILDNLNIGLRKESWRNNKKRQVRSSLGDQMSEDDDLTSQNNYSKTSHNKDDSLKQQDNEEENEIDMNQIDNNCEVDELGLLTDDEDYDLYDNDDDDQHDQHDLDESIGDNKNYDNSNAYTNNDEDHKIKNDKNLDSSNKLVKKKNLSLHKLCISTSSLRANKPRQPHIIYLGFDISNRENKAPKASISEVLNALDMPGAVKDTKRFNYVCRLVQLIINEKLNQLSGNAQRTLFMIVKELVYQVIKTQENLNVMRKLLFDFKKKIQDSIYYYFYYIGSQKLGEKHLSTITKWQELLDNPNHKHVKRLAKSNLGKKFSNETSTDESNENDKENNTTNRIGFEHIPFDCKLEIMRRLNTGLDLVNLSKCNRTLNDIVSKELTIWKNLCQFHYQQANINSFVNKSIKPNRPKYDRNGELIESDDATESNKLKQKNEIEQTNDLDWKLIYFRLKKRYGHREVYVDMVHKCYHCKSLFWKEIGHPCPIVSSLGDELEVRTEPITPKKLIDLLLR